MFASRLLLVVLLALFSYGPGAHAQDSGDMSVPETISRSDRLAIQSVIVAQIKAFQREDDLAAFSLAAPDVRRQFGSAQAFVTMVKSGYEAVYRNRSATFMEATVIDGSIVQAMRIVQSDGDVVIAMFSMERQANGDWRVAGCELAPSDLVSA